MIQRHTVAAVVLAAGSSTRFGQGGNKTLRLLGGEPVLAHSLRVFAEHPKVDRILVAAREEELPQVAALLEELALKKPVQALAGGNTRQQSVLRCLEAADADWVLIHDGARPFLRPAFIDGILAALSQVPGATVGVPVKDTVKITDDLGRVASTTRRDRTWLIQTPQGFDRKTLLDCHRRYGSDPGITDDCMLLERAGLPVQVLPGHETNLKITTPGDLELARFYQAQGL